MQAKFAAYNLELQEVLIGTPRAAARRPDREDPAPAARAPGRREQVATYQEQEKAAVQERTLNEAKATAAAQNGADPVADPGQGARERRRRGAGARAKGRRDRAGHGGGGGRKSRLEGQGEATAARDRHRQRQRDQLSVDAYGGPEYRLAEQNFARSPMP